MDASQTNGHAREDVEQGVTSASLRLTLPITHFVRNGGDALVEKRTHCVSTRVANDELAVLLADAKARHLKLGALLRETYFDPSRPTVPQVNLAKWQSLEKALGDLQRLAFGLNAGQLPGDVRPVLGEVIEGIHHLRADLAGQRETTKGGSGDER